MEKAERYVLEIDCSEGLSTDRSEVCEGVLKTGPDDEFERIQSSSSSLMPMEAPHAGN